MIVCDTTHSAQYGVALSSKYKPVFLPQTDAGYDVGIASVKGGDAPIDPNSYGEDGKRPASVQRFLDDGGRMAGLTSTRAEAEIDPREFRAVFLPGGHGTMWDFTDARLTELLGIAWDHRWHCRDDARCDAAL